MGAQQMSAVTTTIIIIVIWKGWSASEAIREKNTITLREIEKRGHSKGWKMNLVQLVEGYSKVAQLTSRAI